MLATSKQPLTNLFNSIDQQQEQQEQQENMNKDSLNNNNNNNTKNINSPDYNYYLNYSIDSPIATDSSTTPFSNNETTTTNTSSLSSSTNKDISNNNNSNTVNLNSIDTAMDDNITNNTNNNNNNNNKVSPTDDLTHDDSTTSPSNEYLINTPTISSPSLSSSTTKLNTANNSMNNLSKLNFRLNYISSSSSHNVKNNKLSINNNTLPSSTNTTSTSTYTSHPNVISDGSIAMEDSPINNLSSPSVMNDLLDLLDAKETEKQQQIHPSNNNNNTNSNKLISPLQLLNQLNHSPSFIDDDSINNLSAQPQSNLLNLDETFSPHQNSTRDRRTSVVVNNNNMFPAFNDTRNSISHNIDFWNLNEDKSLENDPVSMDIDNDDENIDPSSTQINYNKNNSNNNNNNYNNNNNNIPNLDDPATIQSLDTAVSQVLNGYNMDFSKNNNTSVSDAAATNNNNNNNSNITTTTTDFNNYLYSPKQDISRRQRSSMPSISDRAIFDTLYENVTLNSSENNNNSNNNNNTNTMTPEVNHKFSFDDENALLSDLDNEDLTMTPFKSNISNGKGNNNNNNNLLTTPSRNNSTEDSHNNNSLLPNNVDEILNQLNDTSKETKFIKPSMMLSEKASMAAKLAIKGLPKLDTFPTIDFQPYNHPTRITKRKSVSSATSNGSSIHRNSFTNTRRKSTIGVVRSTPSMTPNTPSTATSTSTSQSKRNSVSGPSVSSTVNFDNPEDKPFQCSECTKAFKRSEHLKRHIRSVHSNERPFACTLCEKKFSRSDNLSQHLKTHKKHGDF